MDKLKREECSTEEEIERMVKTIMDITQAFEFEDRLLILAMGGYTKEDFLKWEKLQKETI